MKIYLAGPITGLTLREAKGQRDKVEERLVAEGFEVLNPLRGIALGLRRKITSARIEDDPRRSDKAMVGRDLADIMVSDVVLFDFSGAITLSIGSCAEIGMCHALHKFAVVVIDKGSIYDHPFIREAGPVFYELEEAFEYIVESLPRS